MAERIHAVTLGTSSLGSAIARGSADEQDAIRAAMALYTGPFARIDTANAYGGGRSEEILGAARRRLVDAGSGDSDLASVITKVDADPSSGALDRDRVLRSYEESLTRLGVERVRLLFLHDPYTVSFAEAAARGGAIEGMVELRERGAVDAIGVAAGPIGLLTEYVRSEAFDAVLTHNRCTLVDRSASALLAEARGRGMSTFNAAPFGGGLLVKGTSAGDRYGYRPASAQVLDRVRSVESVCAAHGIPLAVAALHFSMRSDLVDSTVVGVSSPARLAELEAFVRASVPEELWNALDALGPTPDPMARLEAGAR